MIALAIALRGRENPFILYYDKMDNAIQRQDKLVQQCLDPGQISILMTDDYNHRLVILPHDILCTIISDPGREMDVQIDMQKVQQQKMSGGAPSIMTPGSMRNSFGRPQ